MNYVKGALEKALDAANKEVVYFEQQKEFAENELARMKECLEAANEKVTQLSAALEPKIIGTSQAMSVQELANALWKQCGKLGAGR